MDIAFTQQATGRVDPIEEPQVLEFLRPALMRSSIMEELKKYTNSSFMVPNLLIPSYWNDIGFDPKVTRQTYSNLGLVEIRQDSILPGDDVYIVAQQATQVYYLPYACQTKSHLKGWDIVHRVSPHGKVPVPNDEDYNLDPNTYDGEFFQEEGLEGRFEIDLTKAIEIEVDNETVIEEDARDEVQNVKDLQMLERLHLDNDNGNIAHSDSVDYFDMIDSDDETYDAANLDHEDYF